ncbi:MAG: cation-translocating P-type ATPase [Candidatus Doudnabacteria bacterium]|nr:cation-translocating P-type ATPase [Candidatus Doudnabacteria bacterium]
MNEGLSTTEAKKLLHELGPNRLSDGSQFSFYGLLFSEVFSFLNILLILAGFVALAIKDILDAILIFAIVLLNSMMSFWQEYKAERTLEELKNLTYSYVRVIRNGKAVPLNSEELVPGDIVYLEIGDKVPADGLVLESLNLEVNESALTGEALPVYKLPSDIEKNQVFGGTLVVAGHGKIKISATGTQTRFGRIAQTLESMRETETPLQLQIKHLTLNVALIAIVASVLIYITGISLGHKQIDMFLVGVSTAVAAIPEGLPAIILITLAVGVKRMALRKAVVRKMVAVEALGSINVIATDKTGTLTSGEMKVQKLWFDGKLLGPEEFKHTLKSNAAANKLLDALIFPTTASLAYKFDHGTKAVLGDSTEGALLILAQSLGINYEVHKQQAKLVEEFGFDQKRKTMSVIVERDNGLEAFIKASPEYTVQYSTRILQDGKIRILNENDKQQLTKQFENLGKNGYRILGFAYRNNINRSPRYVRAEVESDLVFLGFACISDPIRPEAVEAIRLASKAGIRTIMVTGDNQLTAMSVARQLGLAAEGDEVITGQDLEKISDEELQSVIWKVKIFARTNPEDKLRIVKALQTAGAAVAVTGDGVNDALALKQAEIGVAMGKKGTDVAKEAADIVITDDNYSSIVRAVEEGRTIYDNVLKSIRYLISTNISELATILMALLIGLPLPLVPAQILWINLISDGLPAIALALDPKDPDAMRRPPRSKEHRLLDLASFALLLLYGLIIAVIALAAYWQILKTTGNVVLARTWTFTILILLQLLMAFIIRRNSHTNYKLILAAVFTVGIQFLILINPIFYPLFKIQKPW